MSSEKRRYELKSRAERQRRTRERIVQATMDLHGEVGPSRTTIAEIARRAGVQRLTVYNHFPEEAELFGACQAHWLSLHPLPDLGAALGLPDPVERLRAVLRDYYGWYRDTEPMAEKVQRDRGALAPLDDVLRQTADRGLAQLADALAAGFSRRRGGTDTRRALIRLALDFSTWHRLDREGLDDDAAATLMAQAAAPSPQPIVVLDDGRELSFSFEEMLDYHGGGSPGGVAHAFKVLERMLPLLDGTSRVQRRSIVIETAFGGPGARDAFELVTRAVSEQRYIIDPELARPELGRARERFVFRVRSGERAVTVALRPGFVTDDFIELTRRPDRTAAEEDRLTVMKGEMAARVMAAAASDVYDVQSAA